MQTKSGDMPAIPFGVRVSVSKQLRRRTKRKKSDKANKYTGKHRVFDYKHWAEYPIKERECLFIGYRTLANGENDYHGDGVVVFRPHDYIKVALVVADENTNPFYAPLDSLLAELEK